jgi:hypothetical protein
VKAPGGQSPYEAWAAGVRAGKAIVTNGPLVEVALKEGTATATAQFYRPLEKLEIVRNGEVIASAAGDGRRTTLSLSAPVDCPASCWVAARVQARKKPQEPDIQAQPTSLFAQGRATSAPRRRGRCSRRGGRRVNYYRNAGPIFPSEPRKTEFSTPASGAEGAARGSVD